jgi:glycine/D-amino acid oxidase-like deaminating enzyme
VFERVGVSGVETEAFAGAAGAHQQRVTAVLTDTGQRIKTTRVVNAAGAWANNVARMVGHELPILAMKVRGGDRRCEAAPLHC